MCVILQLTGKKPKLAGCVSITPITINNFSMIRCRGGGRLSSLQLHLFFDATAEPVHAAINRKSQQLQPLTCKTGQAVIWCFISPWESAAFRLAGADWASSLSSCMSVNLPSCHRAAFPPLFAQLIPFPYKECERQRAAIQGEKNETSCHKTFVNTLQQVTKCMKSSLVM